MYWSFQALGGVRTAISVGPTSEPGGFAAYFGDVRGNVYAVDAGTGQQLWTHRPDPHPIARITGAPALYAGRLYVPVSSLEEAVGVNPEYECCTFRGSVVAYDASTGRVIWKTYTIPDEPRPTRKTSRGTQLWAPAGASVWSAPTIDGGMLFGSAADEQLAYFPNNDSRLGSDAAGGLAVVRLETGERVWFTRPPRMTCGDDDCVQGQAAAVTVIPGVVFSASTNGVMRAYSTADGQIIWEQGTVLEYSAVNGVAAKGGRIGGPGPTIVDGRLFMTSGYAPFGGEGGNVLLVFSAE